MRYNSDYKKSEISFGNHAAATGVPLLQHDS